MVESLLDDVPGLGEVRRRTLLTHFGSLKKLRGATAEELAQVPGIGLRTAAEMVEATSVLVDAGLAEVITVPSGVGRPRRVIRGRP